VVVLTALMTAVTVVAVAVLDDVASPVSLETIGLNYEVLRATVARHHGWAILLYVAAYATLAVLLLPGSALMVVTGGLLFGPTLGIPLAWAASILAATSAFLLARGMVPALLPRDHPLLERLRAGFRRRAIGYLLFLRLSPGLPFALVNVAPAALGVPLWKFVLATAVGFVPSRIALVTAGAGLAEVITAANRRHAACRDAAGRDGATDPCVYDVTMSSLLTPEMVAALLVLAGLALLPALIDGARAARRRSY
jgi:uncharacterized membrane protein YdjX (TVP38/TMEM64 family)